MKTIITISILTTCLATLSGYATMTPSPSQQSSSEDKTVQAPLQREDIQHFIDGMVKKQHFQKDELNQLFAQVHLRPKIVSTIKSPKEKSTWGSYQKLFLQQNRINKGTDFAKNHQITLDRAEKEYGVPKDIILGILGVETYYGSSQGQHRVIDALATLAFNYKKRSKFFRSELESYLIMTRNNHLDPLALKGSYAGAMGYAQFMPSSYLDYAVDYSNSGTIDLFHDPEDAIGSIANYLSKRGHWQKGQAVLEKLSQPKPEKLKLGKHSLKVLREQGIQVKANLPDDTIAQLFEVECDGTKELYLGFPNFKAILSYNPRINYAMAVYHLAVAVHFNQDKVMTSSLNQPQDNPSVQKTSQLTPIE